MALDIRLDFITNINPLTIHDMTNMRQEFIAIDESLKGIADNLEAMKNPAGLRAIALARTHLETALMFSIKSLCIMGETVQV